jgi:SAM-dependent methyltransferase
VTLTTNQLDLLEPGLWVAQTHSAVSYPEWWSTECFQVEDRSFWFRHRNACILQAVENAPPPGVLYDVGGGNGYVAAGLKGKGFDAVVVEPCLAAARNARHRGIEPVICAALDDAGFAPGSLPAVGLFDVIEHIEDDAAFLHSLSALLQENGSLYLTVPAYRLLWSPEDQSAGHYRRYSLRSLVRRLNEAGFRVEYATYFFSYLVAPILLCRALPGVLGLAKHHKPGEELRGHEAARAGTWLLDWLCRWELSRIRRRRRIALGSSCLVVARRAGHNQTSS